MNVNVLIAGGGPAGLSAAATAAQDGCKVVVVERDKEIGKIVRTSGITWIDEMNEFNIPSGLYNPVKKYYMYSPDNQLFLETEEPKACVLDVTKTYQYLAQQALKGGAIIQLNTTIEGVKFKNEKFIVHVKTSEGRKKIYPKIIIEASGYSNIISNCLGLTSKWSRFGVGAEYEADVENVDEKAWYLMVGKRYSPAGYAWILPLGKNKVRIGVGIGRPESLMSPLQRLNLIIKKKLDPIGDLGNISPIILHQGIVPNGDLRPNTVFDRLVLVGDAAGHLNPLILEGIRFSIRFGRIAGEVVNNSLKKNDLTKRSLEEYALKWKKYFWKKFQVAFNVQKKWLHFSDSQWDKEFNYLKCLSAEDFLKLIRADFSINYLMGILSKHPKLMSSQIFKMILKSIKYLF